MLLGSGALGYLHGVRVGSCCDDALWVTCSWTVETFLSFPILVCFVKDAENMRSRCDCGYLRGDDSSSQDCSIAALNLLVVVACVYRAQPFVMRFQSFVLPVLCVACSISRHQRTRVKGLGKEYKGEKGTSLFPGRKD